MDVNEMIKNPEMLIQLDENKYYDKGTHEKCFLHPESKDLCIKIAYNRGTKGPTS